MSNLLLLISAVVVAAFTGASLGNGSLSGILICVACYMIETDCIHSFYFIMLVQPVTQSPCSVIALGMTVLITGAFTLAFHDYLHRVEYAALYSREKRREEW